MSVPVVTLPRLARVVFGHGNPALLNPQLPHRPRLAGEDDRLPCGLQARLALGEARVAGDENLAVATGDERASGNAKAPDGAGVVDWLYPCQRGGGEP